MQQEREIIFDPLNLTPFPDGDGERLEFVMGERST